MGASHVQWLNMPMFTTQRNTGSDHPPVHQAGSRPRRLSDLASDTPADRHRAVDLYRVVAMAAVAIGHWMAVAAAVGPDGELVAGNALEQASSLAWASWLFQVMPLFFVVGGFASALSLDANDRRGGRPQDWVAARLRRMLAPAAVLAGTWLGVLVLGTAVGLGSLVAAGAVAAAIPLWFLANYTIDTALAPHLLPRFRRRPRLVAGVGVGLFLALEILRLAGVGLLPHLNWVLGWLLFQTAGFAWRDGLLPTGRRLAAVAVALWAAALAAVTVGPYPVSMVHFPGIGDLSPTHPPSLALLLFGAASSATAIAAAPAVTRWLSRPDRARAWTVVVAGNTVAMSVYLWHMTAAVAATGVLYHVGLLPRSTVGSGWWWLEKLPLMALAAVILVAIVALVSPFERRALLAPRRAWSGGVGSITAVALVVSTAVKFWTSHLPVAVVGATVVVVAVHALLDARLEPARLASALRADHPDPRALPLPIPVPVTERDSKRQGPRR